MPALLLAAEESDLEQSWPGLFWLPPADDGPRAHDMLHLDDELTGLIEATEMSADQHVAHTAKPEATTSSVPGEGSVVHGKLAAALLVLCCAVLCCAVLCCAVLGHECVLHGSVMKVGFALPCIR